MKPLTPLQWAVLLAYSHSLPHGPERDRVRRLVDSNKPERCGPALVLAASTGMTRYGKITPLGTEAARGLLLKLWTRWPE